ncbi:MAG: DUF1223 domain-containing protein [Pseudomonadales bacterium]
MIVLSFWTALRSCCAHRRCWLVGSLLCACFLSGAIAHADVPLRLSSGSLQTPLVELYTSQGCSSCPPADRWLAQLADTDGLWRRYVPLAFHVTYWDYLGWRDRFAQPAHDARQRALAKRVSSGVYTPGVFLQGREWRNWRRPGASTARWQQQQPLVGVLQAKVNCAGAEIQFVKDPQAAQLPTHVEWAWLLSGQRSDVSRGENRGRELHHEFVVAKHRRVRLHSVPAAAGLQGRVSARFADACAEAGTPQAVAIWVTDPQGNPIQAVGGYLPEGFDPAL